ncbi:MAG: serine/threonine-protein kinase, partial [Planctomycetota bacterium]
AETIGHFQLVETLGMGAFGLVHKAKDQVLDRWVAVKIPRKGQLTPKEAEVFLREARTAAQLSHPNIVSVFEVGRADESVYIVSDYIQGVTLLDFISGRRVSAREAATLAQQICHGLAHAHQHGVVHRDLKPANIMLDGNNEPRIMDFGLAKRDVGELTMTVEGQVLGSPGYMSPEQARGDSHAVDGRADIYAMGVILFKMLTGELPFRGSARMVMHQVLTEEAPSPRLLNSSIPKDLETICLRCLEKDPRKRFSTAEALEAELQRFLEGKPILSRRIGNVARTWRWCKRNPSIAIWSGVAVASLLIGTLVSSAFAVQAGIESSRADERASYAMQQESAARENALLASQKATEATHAAMYAQAESALIRGRTAVALRLNQSALSDGELDASQWDLGYQSSRILEAADSKRRLLANITTRSRAAWARLLTPGTLLYQESQSPHEVVSYELHSESEVARIRVPDVWSMVTKCFGNTIVAVQGDELIVIDEPDHLTITSRIRLEKKVAVIASAAASKRIAILYQDGTACIRDASTLELIAERNLPASSFAPGTQVALSSQGNRLLVKLSFTRRIIWDIERDLDFNDGGGFGHLTALCDDDNDEAYSISFESSFMSKLRAKLAKWNSDGILVNTGVARTVEGISLTGPCTIFDVGKGDDFESREAAVFSDSEYSLFTLGSSIAPRTGLFADLVPQAEGPVRLIDHHQDGWLMVVQSAEKLFVVEPEPIQGITDVYRSRRTFLSAGQQLPTYDYAFGGSKKAAFTVRDRNRIHRTEYASGATESFSIEAPACPSESFWVVARISASPDEASLNCLWHQLSKRDPEGAVERELVACYDLAGSKPNEFVKVRFLADPCGDTKTPGGRVLRLSSGPEGRIVLCPFYVPSSPECNALLYETTERRLVAKVTHGDSCEPSPDRSLFALFDRSRAGEIHVHSTTDGRRKQTIAVTAPVRRLAFSPDNRSLYVGFTDDRFCRYDLATGKKQNEVASRIAPVQLLEGSTLYFGVRYESPTRGALILSDLDHGQPLEVVIPAIWYMCQMFVSADQLSVAVMGPKTRGLIIRSLDPNELDSQLSRVLKRSYAWSHSRLSEDMRRARTAELTRRVESIFVDQGINKAFAYAEELQQAGLNINLELMKRDMNVRFLRWEEALQASEATVDVNQRAQHAMILFRTGRLQQYRECRQQILDEITTQPPGWKLHQTMIAVLLMPLDPENRAKVEQLAEWAKDCPQRWERAMFKSALARLGKLSSWKPKTELEKKLPAHPMSQRVNEFRENPTPQTRARLKEQVVALQKAIEQSKLSGRTPSPHWHDYVERVSYYEESKALLDGDVTKGK